MLLLWAITRHHNMTQNRALSTHSGFRFSCCHFVEAKLGQWLESSHAKHLLPYVDGPMKACTCVATGKPARGVDVVEDKAELSSLLEAEKSRRRLLEQRFSTAEAEADKLRYTLPTTSACCSVSAALVRAPACRPPLQSSRAALLP